MITLEVNLRAVLVGSGYLEVRVKNIASRCISSIMTIFLVGLCFISGAPLSHASGTSGVQQVAIPAASGNISDTNGQGVLAAQLAATDTAVFDQVALSWEAGGSADLTAQLRLRQKGIWQSWQTLEVVESDKGRIGTDIPFVGDADGFEV